MRALFDTDVVPDLVLEREPFADAAASLFELHEQGRIDGHIPGITPVNVFYVTRKEKGIDRAKGAVGELVTSLNVCPVDRSVLETASKLPFADYEDAVQHACAVAAGLDVIVTRNAEDYKAATLPVMSPKDFLTQLNPQQP